MDCKEWPYSRLPKGYGLRNRKDGGTQLVHRQEMEKHLGRRLDPSEVVMHICDNPPCYEISHLRLGTTAENNADMAEKGRASNQYQGVERCKNDHPFDDENTYTRPNGQRTCRACNKEASARKRAKRKMTIVA